MKIYTSYYSNKKINNEYHTPIRISIYPPRFKIGYKIEDTIPELMPSREIFKMSTYEERRDAYIRRLESIVDIEKLRKSFEAYQRPPVLLCFENLSKDDAKCHRRLFAAWWQEKTGEIIDEL